MSTEFIAIVGAIATVLAGFGGAALGACFAYKTGMKLVQKTHKNAIDLAYRQEFNKAASKFRNAFNPEIIFLKHNARISSAGSSDNLQEFLLYGYIRRHLSALVVFKPYLSAKEQKDIDQAWQEYCYHPDNPKVLFFEQYSWKVANKGKDYEKELKSLALIRIEKILEFSKHK